MERKVTLSDAEIAAVPAPVKRAQFKVVGKDGVDIPGLHLDVQPSGRKRYLVRFSLNGKQTTYSIGSTSDVRPARAQSICIDVLAYARDGKSYGEIEAAREREAQAQAKGKGLTVQKLIDTWLEKHARPNLKDISLDLHLINRHLTPLVGQKDAKTLSKMDVNEMVERIIKNGFVSQNAHKAKALLCRVYNYAIDMELGVTSNPAVKPKRKRKEAEGERYGSRARVLTPAEVGRFVVLLRGGTVPQHLARAAWAALYTGRRRSEMCRAPASQRVVVDGMTLWRIPKETKRTRSEAAKNGMQHDLPMSRQMVDVLKGGSSKWLFPGSERSGGGDKHIEAIYLTHEIGDLLRLAGIEGACLHDLRRTMATGITALGVEDVVKKHIMNHVEKKSDVTEIHYNKHRPMKKVAEMMQLWADVIDAIGEGRINGSDPEQYPWEGILDRITERQIDGVLSAA